MTVIIINFVMISVMIVICYSVPGIKVKSLRQAYFNYSGTDSLNNLPKDVLTAKTLDDFRQKITLGLLISTPIRQICKTAYR